MTDDSPLDLRGIYGRELSKAIAAFKSDLGSELDGLSIEDTVRLFTRYSGYPAYETWRAVQLHNAAVQARVRPLEPETQASSAMNEPRQADSRLRAVQILGGERMTKAEWARAMDWARAHGGRRLKGDDGKWNLTEEELAEAIR